MGRPKALLTDSHGVALADVAVDRLLEAGCAEVTVVLGAEADQVLSLLRERPADRCRVVVARDWSEGMGASLRSGLEMLDDAAPDEISAALVTLVDLPDVGVPVMARVLGQWRAGGASPDALLRATYDRDPGHPVLLGRAHWAPLTSSLTGDTGAQRYLNRRRVHQVSCGDLATGRDVDRPEDLTSPGRRRRPSWPTGSRPPGTSPTTLSRRSGSWPSSWPVRCSSRASRGPARPRSRRRSRRRWSCR
jgi:CTP:molybdopterin cytidylyltransferase MocA